MNKSFYVLPLVMGTFSSLAIAAPVPVNGSIEMQAKMDQAFHYYAMVCSITPWNPVTAKKKPNNGGHELMYLKGACRDKEAEFPAVKMCDEATTNLDDGNSGVALSVDKILYNSHFLVTEGRDLMFDGVRNRDESISEEWRTKTVNAIVASGELKNVEIHPELVAKPYSYTLGDSRVRYMGEDGKEKSELSMSTEAYIAKLGVDTDYGILGAREAQCATVPLTKSQVEAIVVAANEYNKPYTSGKKINDWNGTNKNCTSFVRNMMAAARVRTHFAEWNSGGWLGRAFFSLLDTLTLRVQIPKNDSLKTAELANQIEKIGTAEEAYADKASREAFNSLHTLPTLGAILQIYPMIEDKEGEGNTLYVHRFDTLFKDIPLLRPRAKLLASYLSDPDYNVMSDNLNLLLKQLTDVQANLTPVKDIKDSDFKEFAERYNQWIDESIVGVKQKILILGQ